MRPVAGIFLLIMLTTGVSGANAESPWPMFRRDRKHTGQTAYTGPAIPELKWTFPVKDGIASSPSIGHNGTIYFGAGWNVFGTTDSALYAVNPDGSLKWRFATGGGVFSSPTVGPDGTLYFTAYDTSIYALEDSVTYARVRWKTAVGYFFVMSSPALSSDGTVYVGSPSFYFYSINPQGVINWQYKTGWCIISSPAIGDDGTVYVGSKDHHLYAFRDELEGPLWGFATGTFFDGHLVDASPAIGPDGTIYVGSDQYGAAGQVPIPVDTSFWAVNPDGTLKWAVATNDGVESSPAIASDGTIYFGSYDSCLYAVADSGLYPVVKWKYKTGGPIDGSPTVDGDGIIYFGSRDSVLYALTPDGTVKWTYRAGGEFESSPTIDGQGNLYIGCFDGRLYAFGTGAPDVGVMSVDVPDTVKTGDPFIPQATVRNFRAKAVDCDVVCTIEDSTAIVYNETLGVGLNDGESRPVSFPPWGVGSLDGAAYSITVRTVLSTDDNAGNDIKEATTLGIDYPVTCGDANGDGLVNAGDAVFLIFHIFKGGPAPYPYSAADANGDGTVNLGDAIYLIVYIFRGGQAPICG